MMDSGDVLSLKMSLTRLVLRTVFGAISCKDSDNQQLHCRQRRFAARNSNNDNNNYKH
jgi:hypothetical protein